MTRVTLARTLRLVSEQGIDTFYNGQLAEKIVAEIQHRGIDRERHAASGSVLSGGILTRDDLRQYRVDFARATSINLTDSLEAHSSSLPSSGPLLLFILNLFRGPSLLFSSLVLLQRRSSICFRLQLSRGTSR